MKFHVILGAATLALILSCQLLQAQSRNVPAEFPPVEFVGNQFVDSKGCAFIRAGVVGLVTWVPRVDRRRNQLCHFQATFPKAPLIAVAPQARDVADLISGNRYVGSPIETVASPIVALSAEQFPTVNTVTARSPQIKRIVPIEEQIKPVTMQTRAALCFGKTGLQLGFVSLATGETIDCGVSQIPAVQVAAVLLQTKAELCIGRTGLQDGLVSYPTGQTIDCGSAAETFAPAAALSLTTMDQICTDIRVAGSIFAKTQTGLEVKCEQSTQPNITQNTIFDSIAQVMRGTITTSTVLPFDPKPIPASNPEGVSQAEVLPMPAGYRRVWSDGRHNPNRGLP